jgi:prepilin-type N-terminal cleavage/methylation domain-containing protein
MKKGFTLIEILVVVAIMAVLTAIVYTSFNSAKAGSRDQKRVSDISALQLGLEHYFNANGIYPTSTAALAPTYIPSVPADPQTNQPYGYFPMTRQSGSTYCTAYHLWTLFETKSSYLSSKRGFNSAAVYAAGSNGWNGFYTCGSPSATSSIDASSTASIYDVLSQ